MDRQALIERLMATFLEELEEYVGAFDRDLLAFETACETPARQDLLITLFRTAHSLKGAARAVDQKNIETVAHYLEDILSCARGDPATIDGAMLQVLFESADALRDAAARLRGKKGLEGSAIASILPRLMGLGGGERTRSAGVSGEAGPGPQGKPRATPRLSLPHHNVAAAQPASPRSEPFINVAAHKIDLLLDRGGEMLIARRRISAHGEAVSSLHQEVRAWHRIWRSNSGSFRRNRDAAAAAAIQENESRLTWLEGELDRLASAISLDHHRLAQAAAPLESELRILRMIPFARAAEGLDRVVRDLARDLGKKCELIVEGGAVEIDRSILETLRSPLMQLVRNAISHGIERPEERGVKPGRGRIRLCAALRGSRVEIIVADDGRGLDLRAIRERSGAMGLDVPWSDEEAAQLIFWPGLSTAAAVSGASGRGIGLDIVKSRVHSLHGTIDVSSSAGSETTFRISVPLTLTTIRAVLVNASGQTFALETTGVARLARIDRSQIRLVEEREVVAVDDALLPLISLGALLELHAPKAERPGKVSVVVIQDGRHAVALVVDELLSEQEIVAKNLGRRVGSIQKIAGTTLLPDGRLALILNAAELVETVRESHMSAAISRRDPERPWKARRRLLVVEDSVTTRALQKSILESAGYEVMLASDGEEAWRLLSHDLPDLVITDIEMPKMDGFALTEAIRRSSRHRHLPVVLLTALVSDADKARGLEAGANAYLVKSSFDQSMLLRTIVQLLG